MLLWFPSPWEVLGLVPHRQNWPQGGVVSLTLAGVGIGTTSVGLATCFCGFPHLGRRWDWYHIVKIGNPLLWCPSPWQVLGLVPQRAIESMPRWLFEGTI